MFSSILVATDLGSDGDRASQVAGVLAARAGLPISLVHVCRPGPDAEESQALLAAAAAELAERVGVSSLHITFLTEAEWAARMKWRADEDRKRYRNEPCPRGGAELGDR